jgi:methyl-accepting chemotaxis protein
VEFLNRISIARRLYGLVAGGAIAVVALTGLCAYTAQTMYQAAVQTPVSSATELRSLRDGLVIAATAICITSLAVVVPFFVVVTKSITRRVKIAQLSLERVAERDLTGSVAVEGQDEVSELQRTIAKMQVDLTEIIGGVRIRTEEMCDAVNEIAVGNDDLSVRTEMQAASLQQTASNLIGMSRAVSETANGTDRAKSLALRALELSDGSGAAVQELVAHMDRIREQSNKIGEIVSLIESIAFQTNILALNAAVEAARAGDVGRGFSVVAGEVRTLAGRCSIAAKEIKHLITSAHSEIQQGAAAAGTTGLAMDRLSKAVQGANELVVQINASATSQARDLSDIELELSRVDSVTQHNAALVEQAAAAASSVRSKANELRDSVEAFRLAPSN